MALVYVEDSEKREIYSFREKVYYVFLIGSLEELIREGGG